MSYETTPEVRARLRAERRRRGWDIPRLARELRDAAEHPHKMPSPLHIQRTIERHESGEVRRIGERYRILYARALNMSVDDLFGSAPEPLPTPEPADSDVEVIRNMLTALTTSDRQFGGAHARQYGANYLATVIEPRLYGNAPSALRRRLFAVSTEFTMRVSGMHLDADQPDVASELLGRAASMASESSDLTLTAWILSRRGEHEIHQAVLAKRAAQRAAHIDQALAYTEGAVGVARAAPPLSRAFIGTKHALAWSMTGNRAQTQRALRIVWDAYDRAGTAAEPDWMGVYGWAHLRHEESRCYVNLGMGRQAVNAATDCLAMRNDLRPRAFSLGILAIGHAQSNEVEQACDSGHDLIRLAGQVTSRRVRMRMAEVLNALKPYRNQPAVTALREAARPLLHSSG